MRYALSLAVALACCGCNTDDPTLTESCVCGPEIERAMESVLDTCTVQDGEIIIQLHAWIDHEIGRLERRIEVLESALR
jgi:hypothetical protein